MARTEREDSATPVRTTSGSSTYRRRRPSEFQLPDGRKILVALPEEAEALRTKYSTSAAAGGGEESQLQTEVVVHGSAEHQRFLQLAHAHHELRRAELRARHGSDFEEWENVSTQLDAVTAQLESIADHSASLKENFSKFGYDARLRTYGEEKHGGGSGAGSSSASLNEEKIDWNERRNADTVKLFKKPVIKQYFHRGLLWRSSDESSVESFELFFDLLYVGIIAINGDHVSEEPNGHELLRFVVTFCMSWKIWSDVAMLISWFETNDILQRVEILFLIACLLGLTTNMLQTFNHEHDTYVQLTGFYLTSRLFMAAYCALTGFLLPLVKGMMISQIGLLILGSVLWIGSTQVEMPARLGLVFAALFVDFCGSTVYVSLFRYARNHDNKMAQRIEKFYEFYPAINIEHKVERTNAFVSLVLGYGVVGLMYQNAGNFALNAFLGKAVLGLVQSFIFNWIYFEIDGSNLHIHAIRRHANTAFLWQFSHLFFIMAYIVAAAGLSKLVVATDCSDAPIDTLTEFYMEKAEDELALGIRLFYCVGLGIALFCMGLINFSHEHKVPPFCRVPRWLRLTNRGAVCIIFCCLPASEHLNSLDLISITTALTAWVLILELFGKSSKGDSLFGDGTKCRYTAQCSKKDLEKAMKSDGEVDVMELGRREKTAVPAGVD